ncbi:hypothetical protein [Bradyrhizobium sp. 162]|uniref:hypothetical protein n=1 Tax=Bradyrhizobium sp. 162 TaxID=2782635 RepID=UPI001FF970E0|nr:hypothetical protein [Bradyrhizobium sp. 162]MCK1629675.1 hypothetical protein [Bradyrhizobium sp. 162]
MNAIRLAAPTYPRTFGSGGVSASAGEIDQVLVANRPLQVETRKIWSLSSDTGRPSEKAVSSAIRTLGILFGKAVKLGSWSSPHITLSENNEIVFEWWNDHKKITLYFGDDEPEYIKVWGTDIDNEMDSGPLPGGWNLTALWLWLFP